MALEAGTNSYVTLNEADAYVSAFYYGTPISARWSDLDDPGKELLLLRACSDMDSMPFIGKKRVAGQPLMFPRWPDSAVPDNVKYAQIEIALVEFDDEIQKTINSSQRRLRLQQQGVTAFSLGDLSESYAGRASSLVAQYPFMASDRIARLLGRYLQGGYAIC